MTAFGDRVFEGVITVKALSGDPDLTGWCLTRKGRDVELTVSGRMHRIEVMGAHSRNAAVY